MKQPIRKPKDHVMTHADDVFGPSSGFARGALTSLFRRADELDIEAVHQCSGHWADGYVVMKDGEKIPFEIKDTLGWGSLCSASVQLVSANHELRLNASKGWIIFDKYSNTWQKNPSGATAHAIYCLSKFHAGLDVYFVNVDLNCGIHTTQAVAGKAQSVAQAESEQQSKRFGQ
jgi:hypothetical protein